MLRQFTQPVQETPAKTVLLDMTKVGFENNPIIILTDDEQIKVAMDCIKGLTNHKIFFRSLMSTLGREFGNLEYIYNNRKSSTNKEWEDFCNDCLLYCSYKNIYHKVEFPIITH